MQSKSEQISKLTELNDELENYFRNTIIPQLFVDRDLILRKFTPPAMKQFKLALTDVGRPIADITDNFRFPAIIDNIQHVIDTGEILEKEIQTTDLDWYQMNILPYLDKKQNKTNGVIITFIELTRRIKDLKEQEKLIAENEILLDTLSHDLKGPLTGLSLTLQMLKKVPDMGKEKSLRLLSNGETSVANIQQIINDLTKSRWESPEYQAMEGLLNFEHIIEDVRLTLAHQIEDSKAIIKSEIGISEISFVRRNLRSLLYNLVNNAIKYKSPERKPEILIKTREENGFMVITVTDNGMGIAEKDLDIIFVKYRRISKSIEGTGIGLYLVKQIVNSVGGRITIKSEPGKGSEFTVFLKLVPQ